jgi:peptidoglycan hydrolase-like protein with peptidoglycan-binding domain
MAVVPWPLATLLLLGACSMLDSAPTKTAIPPPAPPAIAPEMRDSTMSPAQIKDVQQKLTDAGLYHGRMDGVWGPGTAAAVTKFQQSKGLTVSGKLDSATSDALTPAKP